ncbi:hypothetical protein Kpol_387p11 [Vanderwaltozyma polyspora DSM 70294]|uniref:PCI domain-containing protein n=1 Tax=Vanderwaltozyma polyspora (strain ATCC 22028 / DSM 70294 / BCRC 21397 / CBS 2163 / NBRC 10782 / NRRL Y-8283 / UCD 57-17) TaxID=436907 RepID=A7TRY0_VANPO|nr:uncharacterized protein Kpol_387p11 [Vanderwaltozyma polyspora DSM 70294]EDO14985.1 hypothetical protein Kpol_387p11 [Vanderwaltozyma polyspora DSM 70294]
MIEKCEGPVLLERINHLLTIKYGSDQDRMKLASDAMLYLQNIDYFNSPYLSVFNSYLGVDNTSNDENIKSELPIKNKLLAKVIAHEYTEAITLLETQNLDHRINYRRIEQICNIYILNKDFKGLEDLEQRLISPQDSVTHLTEQNDELEAHRRSNLLILSSLYFKGRFFDFSNRFFQLLSEDNDIISSLSYSIPGQLLFNKELLYMILISTVLSLPFDEYESLLYSKELISFYKINPLFPKCLELLSKAQFEEFLNIWNTEINEICETSPFLYQSWITCQHLMRCKIYFMHLKLTNKISVDYFTELFKMSQLKIKEELIEFLDFSHVNYSIDHEKNILYYNRQNSLYKSFEILNKNYDTINDIISLKKQENENMRNLAQEIIINNSRSGTLTNTNLTTITTTTSTIRGQTTDDSENEII